MTIIEVGIFDLEESIVKHGVWLKLTILLAMDK